MGINTVLHDKQAMFGMKIILFRREGDAILFLRFIGFMLVADAYLILFFHQVVKKGTL